MKLKNDLLHNFPFYPLLIGLYPVLFLWLANYIQVLSFVVPRSLILSMSFTLVVCLICWLILRDLKKAAALAGLFLVLFYFYGHFFNLVDNLKLFGFVVGRHRYTLPVWGALFVLGSYIIVRSRSTFHDLTWTLNLVSGFMIGITLLQLGYLTITSPHKAARPTQKQAAAQTQETGSQVAQANTPDVYYFLLDAYSRQDMLKENFGLDNSAFIAQLESMGFVVPQCTQSNYGNTVYSMSGTLNMDYLDKLGFSYANLALLDENGYTAKITPLTADNLVMRTFHAAGYKIITLKTPYPFVDYPYSDIVYDVESNTSQLNKLETLNFQYLFMRTTLMRVIIEWQEYAPGQFDNLPPVLLQFINPKDSKFNSRNYKMYQQNLYQLASLENVARVPGKKFVYAHLLVTHQPFTFTADGGFRNIFYDSAAAYADQVTYASQRMLTIVKNILAESSTPPVIILQGDHSSTFDEEQKFRILNAYYLPGAGKDELYPAITPVNSFRLIFSTYFGQDYPLLADQSIVVGKQYPGGYKIMPQTCIR